MTTDRAADYQQQAHIHQVPTYVKSGMDYLPAIKCGYSGNIKVLYGDRLPTIALAKKYAQIEINRINND